MSDVFRCWSHDITVVCNTNTSVVAGSNKISLKLKQSFQGKDTAMSLDYTINNFCKLLSIRSNETAYVMEIPCYFLDRNSLYSG